MEPRVVWRLASGVLLAGLLVLLLPTSLGGRATYVIVSGDSMEPTMSSGDLVVALEDGAQSVGDVVVFRTPQQPLVIHRIVGGDGATGWVPQGDNNPRPDAWRPTDADLLGTQAVLVPGGGALLAYLRQPFVLAGLAAAITVFLVMLEAEEPRGRARPGRSRRRLWAPQSSPRST